MPRIRLIRSTDVEDCVRFGLEAFRPVFASFEKHYGPGLFAAMRPDWENAQSSYIREAITGDSRETWVSTDGEDKTTGFVVLTSNEETSLGEIELMAVDPEHQGQGAGKALSSFSMDRLRDLGMSHAIVATADDESHAPARSVYASAGFAPMSLQSLYMAKEL